MSHLGGPVGAGGFDPCNCDREKVFELVDGRGDPEGIDPEQERKIREHLTSCSRCRELYERELNLNAFLNSLDFSVLRSRSVAQGVAMALPTRSARARVLWGLLAAALLTMAFLSVDFNSTGPVIVAISILGACWDSVVGLADVARVVFAAVGSTILLVLALGALVDLFVAFVVLFARRSRRTREV